MFLGASLQDLGSVGPSTLDLIDREVERLVGDAEARAAFILDRHWSAVEETANALLEQETLSGVALEAVLSTVHEMNARGAARRAPSRARARPGAQTLIVRRRRRGRAGGPVGGGVAARLRDDDAHERSRTGPVGPRLGTRRSELAAGTAPAACRRCFQGSPRATSTTWSSTRPTRGCSASRATRPSPPACSSTTAAAGISSRPCAAARAKSRGSPGPARTSSGSITEPSEPRVGAGLGLCHFKDGVVVGSYSTPCSPPIPSARWTPPPATVRMTAGLRGSAARTPPGSASARFICTGTGRA